MIIQLYNPETNSLEPKVIEWDMKFEIGKYYKTRGGDKVHLTHQGVINTYPLAGDHFIDGEKYHGSWTLEGYAKYFEPGTDHDLVAEWPQGS